MDKAERKQCRILLRRRMRGVANKRRLQALPSRHLLKARAGCGIFAAGS